MIFNKLTGKLYVGLTNNIKRRWQEHRKCGKKINEHSYAVHLAIFKYGVENFDIKSVDQAPSLQEACQKEIQWIKTLKECGYQLYNETDGGEGTRGNPGYVWSKEQRAAMSERASGEKNYFYGKQLFGELNGNYGKKMKPHVKEILLQHRAKLTPSQVQEIRDLYAAGNHTQTGLAKQFGMSLTQIHCIVKGKKWNEGEKPSTKSRLTREQVIELRTLYETGKYTQSVLAKKFHISHDHCNAIIARRKWKDV